VERAVEIVRPMYVERVVDVPVEVPVVYEQFVDVPVERPIYIDVPVEVDVPTQVVIDRPVEVPHMVDVPVEVPVPRPVYMENVVARPAIYEKVYEAKPVVETQAVVESRPILPVTQQYVSLGQQVMGGPIVGAQRTVLGGHDGQLMASGFGQRLGSPLAVNQSHLLQRPAQSLVVNQPGLWGGAPGLYQGGAFYR